MYNLNVQRQLTPTTLLEIGYSGNRGLHLVRSGEANPVINVATRERINPNLGSIPLIVTDAISNYNALQLSLLKRFSSGVMFQLSYTFSKALADQSGTFPADYVSESGVGQNFFDPHRAFCPSPFDRTHVFVANFLYELPFGARHRLASNSTAFRSKLVAGSRLGV